jgi:hypothetical protein
MSMWRCPHCGTPQAEASRCWVCHRSSTTCSTCRNFRRSVAAQIGYCGLDARRLPLAGSELRGCWEPGAARPLEAPTVAAHADDGGPPDPATERSTRLRDFVPVELRRDHRIVVVAADPAAVRQDIEALPVGATAVPIAAEPGSSGMTLFGDGEP